jgi:hypothetical protein
MSTLVRSIAITLLAIVLIVAQIPTSTISSSAVNVTYVDCNRAHSYFSQDLILVSSSTAAALFRATDTGWISVTTPISWTQLRATSGKAIFVYDDSNGLFSRSSDLGATWPVSGTFPLANSYVATQFYPSPISDTLFVGLNDYNINMPGIKGVYKSTDNGAHWSNTGGVTGSDIVFSPNFAADGIAFESYVIYHGSGVNTTTNGGDSWTSASSGLYPSFQGMPYQLAISPDFPNDQTVFAAADTGFYKTTSAGNAWSKLKSGDWFTYTSYYAALSPNYAVDQSVLLVNREQGLELSQDGGTTWQTLLLPSNTTARIAALRVIAPFEWPIPTPPPAMPYHFYLPLITVARTQQLEIWLIADDGIGCKLYRSPDFGKTWQEEIVAETKRQ